MTGGIAHDFRNILAIVASGLQVAERNAGDPAKLESALAAVHEGVERGDQNDIAAPSFRQAAGAGRGPEDVNTLLESSRCFSSTAQGSGFSVMLPLAANLPTCLVDPPQFNAAILNLVVNARDAMPEGGVIRISTAAVRGMNLGQPCDYVRVRVRDDGVGMPPEVIDRIFDPYFTTKGDHGTGLGIPQVQALMQQVGGLSAWTAQSAKGTSFDLFFPVHERPTARPPEMLGESSTSGPTKAEPSSTALRWRRSANERRRSSIMFATDVDMDGTRRGPCSRTSAD